MAQDYKFNIGDLVGWRAMGEEFVVGHRGYDDGTNTYDDADHSYGGIYEYALELVESKEQIEYEAGQSVANHSAPAVSLADQLRVKPKGRILVDKPAVTQVGTYDDEWHAIDKIDDSVHHPSHYTQFGAEVIEITEHLNFCRGNAVKYIARAGFKSPDTEVEDLQKALWYIQRELKRLGAVQR